MDTLVADLCRPHPQIDGPHFGVRASELLAGDHGYRVVANGDGQVWWSPSPAPRRRP